MKPNQIGVDELIDLVTSEIVKPIKPQKPISLPRGKSYPKELALLVSDVHVGKITSSFDLDVFKKRLQDLTVETLKLIDLHKPSKFTVFLNGDIIDGEQIFPSHPYEIEMTATQQYFEASKHFANFIDTISTLCPKVEVIGTAGNHGRMGKKSELPYTSNWEYIMYHYMEALLKSNSRVTFSIPKTWYYVHQMLNTKILITHGDAIKGGGSLASIKASAIKWSVSIPETWDVLCMGHFHAPYDFRYAKKRIVGNGTFVSDDDYAQRELKEYVTPSQTFLIVEPGNQVYVNNYSFKV